MSAAQCLLFPQTCKEGSNMLHKYSTDYGYSCASMMMRIHSCIMYRYMAVTLLTQPNQASKHACMQKKRSFKDYCCDCCFQANSSPTEAECDGDVAKSPAAGTYVRIPPVDNYVSTSNGATTFHTFHPTHSRSSNSDKNSSKFPFFFCMYMLHWNSLVAILCRRVVCRTPHNNGRSPLPFLHSQSSVSKINQAVTQMPSKG